MADESKINLRVLTLNCWGIPYVSKMWEERKVCIGKELAKGHYDLVSLQEIWNRNDFEYISRTVSDVLPYSHYFYSGVNGSGVCVFSRFPIIDTFMYRYSLNGYMYNFTHGDWFGGKAAGYCIIDHPKQPIHFFATHMHAEYSSSQQYMNHRVVQSYQFSQLIRHLTQPNDIVIACGDMNCEPSKLCYRIIKDVTGMIDAWDTHGTKVGCCGNTVDVSHNTFSGDKKSRGSRIDYIFYRCQSGTLECINSLVTMGLVPGRNISFSDHEGVAASFVVTELTREDSADSGPKAISDVKKYQEALRNAQDVLSNATDTLSHRNMFSILIVSAMLIFVMSPVIFPVTDSSSWSLHHIGGKCLHVARIITTIILSGFMFYLIFNVREEYSAYKNIQQMIDIQMKQINPRKRMNGKSGL